MKKILIVEDDESLCKELLELLQNSGFQGVILKNFEHAMESILKESPDLILLDVNIPYCNGNFLLQNLRKKTTIPVIMVTSNNSEADEELSMSYGADDYITKPYNPNILLLRIQAVLKRVSEVKDIVNYRDSIVNIQKGIIEKENQEVILTKNEMLIFNYLLTHRDRIVSRDELMTILWNNEEYINDNALTVNISRLRNKLKSLGYENAIDTRKKVGYILL